MSKTTYIRHRWDHDFDDYPLELWSELDETNTATLTKNEVTNLTDVSQLLELHQLPDFHRTHNGWIAKRRPDIAPLAYEVVVNNPLGEHMEEKIIGFCGGACQEMVLRLFRLCNGLHVGATKFSVYGVLGQSIDREDEDSSAHIPFDINVPNLYGRPKGWPQEVLVVATGRENTSRQEKIQLKHGITPDCRIVVAEKEKFNQPIREYDSVDDWLKFEVMRALDDFSRY